MYDMEHCCLLNQEKTEYIGDFTSKECLSKTALYVDISSQLSPLIYSTANGTVIFRGAQLKYRIVECLIHSVIVWTACRPLTSDVPDAEQMPRIKARDRFGRAKVTMPCKPVAF